MPTKKQLNCFHFAQLSPNVELNNLAKGEIKDFYKVRILKLEI